MNLEMANHGEWISEFGFFVLLALNVATLVKMFTPQKREVSLTREHPSHEELDALASRIEKTELGLEATRRECRSDRDGLLMAVESRFARLEDRLNEVLAAVSELKGKMNGKGKRS